MKTIMKITIIKHLRTSKFMMMKRKNLKKKNLKITLRRRKKLKKLKQSLKS